MVDREMGASDSSTRVGVSFFVPTGTTTFYHPSSDPRGVHTSRDREGMKHSRAVESHVLRRLARGSLFASREHRAASRRRSSTDRAAYIWAPVTRAAWSVLQRRELTYIGLRTRRILVRIQATPPTFRSFAHIFFARAPTAAAYTRHWLAQSETLKGSIPFWPPALARAPIYASTSVGCSLIPSCSDPVGLHSSNGRTIGS